MDTVSGFSDLRQGDWIDCRKLRKIASRALSASRVLSCKDRGIKEGFIILTQTCDVVSNSKLRVILSPVRVVEKSEYNEAIKGSRPTEIPIDLEQPSTSPTRHYYVADTTRCFSVEKNDFPKEFYCVHLINGNNGKQISEFSNRIGRVFTRFPFPDEVHDCLKKLQAKVRSKNNNVNSPLGKVIDLTRAIRISCEDWEEPHRALTFTFVMKSEVFSAHEDCKIVPLSEIDPSSVNSKKNLSECDFPTLCNLIYDNRLTANRSVLASMIEGFVQMFPDGIWGTERNFEPDISSIDANWFSSDEFSLDAIDQSYSLDLEVLSDSTA